jgi:hypothetical protein
MQEDVKHRLVDVRMTRLIHQMMSCGVTTIRLHLHAATLTRSLGTRTLDLLLPKYYSWNVLPRLRTAGTFATLTDSVATTRSGGITRITQHM